MSKKIVNIVILLAAFSITFYIMYKSDELKNIPTLMQSIDVKYVVIAIGLMLVSILMNGIILKLLTNSIGTSIGLMQSLYIGILGQYYNLITPFASGGQPVQILEMKKKYNISYAEGTSITMEKGMLYQITVTFLAIVAYIAQYGFIKATFPRINHFIILGLVINITGSVLFVLLAFWPRLLKKIIMGLMNGLKRLGIFKRMKTEKICNMMDSYTSVVDKLKHNKALTLKLFALTLIQLISFFSITYFVYFSLGYSSASYLQILSIQTILYVIISFIPSPGGVGSSESGFYLLFSIFFKKDVLLLAMLTWRIITYYLNLLLSGTVVLIASLISHFRLKKVFS